LVVNGDQRGTSSDVILLHRNSKNASFAEVVINNIVVSNTPINTLNEIKINGLDGDDTINIEDTFANVPVTINGGNGNDTINISPIAKNLAHFQGSVTISGDGGTDTVILSDQNNASASTYTVNQAGVTRTGTAPISFASSENVALYGGGSASVYNVESTAASTPVKISGGAGGDTFNVSPTAQSVNAIAAAVSIDGGGGSDQLNINDQAGPIMMPNRAAVPSSVFPTYTLNSRGLTRTGPGSAEVDYINVENIAILNGPGNSTLVVDNVPVADVVLFQGGGGVDTVVGSNTTNNDFFFATNEIRLAGTALHLTGVENLKGGALNDTFRFDFASQLAGTIDGGGGNDTLDYSQLTSGVTVNLATGTASKTGVVSNIENVLGTAGADSLAGNAADNILVGNDGNDILSGGGGNDILVGGAGNDLLNGGSGRDLLIGGAGTDNANGGDDDDIVIGAGTVFDTNIPALQAIQKEWTRTDADYLTRIGHLKGTIAGGLNGPTFLNSSTIHDDAIADIAAGAAGQDWFFTKAFDSTDRSSAEVQN
jgi:Ca2+-binding RTX toxin-like protein